RDLPVRHAEDGRSAVLDRGRRGPGALRRLRDRAARAEGHRRRREVAGARPRRLVGHHLDALSAPLRPIEEGRGGRAALTSLETGATHRRRAVDIVLDFERPVLELKKRIDELRTLQEDNGVNLSASIEQLELQVRKLEERIFTRLSPWQRTQLSRHPARPYTLDYVEGLFTEWTELHGDRAGHDDQSLICGLARLAGR